MSSVAEGFDVNQNRNTAETESRSLSTGSVTTGLKWSIPALVVLGLAWFGWSNGWLMGNAATVTSDLLIFEVQPRDLPITVIERGSLESQTNVPVYCEVDDVRSDGINGTPIVWVIDNGASVEEGDLICELDSSAIQAELDEQILDTEEARSSHLQATANLENQEIENATALYKAELDIELAELDLEMFQHDLTGSHKLAVEALDRQIEDLNNDIMAAEMNLKLRNNERSGIEQLFRLGYAGKSELDRSELSYLQAEGDYAAALNKLSTQTAARKKLQTFERKMQMLELKGKLDTATQALRQVEVSNEARLAQMRGILASRTEQLKKEEERLERYQQQLAKCKIYAPQEGMVTYATPRSSRDDEIGEGVAVRPRQHILSIPNLKKMQVKTNIHESVLDRIQVDQRVSVSVDAFPNRSYTGTVKSVAVLPESSYYSDTKTYETIISVDEEVYQLKPGMTAVCEVKVDYLAKVNAVPIQAIVQRGDRNWIYINSEGRVVRRKVSLGPSNDQYVSVLDGISAGDQVVLNPGTLFDDNDGDATEVETLDGETKPADDTLVATNADVPTIN